jgi:hypothetical protein
LRVSIEMLGRIGVAIAKATWMRMAVGSSVRVSVELQGGRTSYKE